MFAWVREGPEALVVWMDSLEEKEALIAASPDRFFTPDHYDGEPIVLVDLAVVDADECGELIADSYRARAPRKLVAQLDGNEAQK